MKDLRAVNGIVTAALTGLLAVGCGGEGDTGGAEAGGEAAEQVEHPVPEAEAGNVSGVVNFEGTAPPPEELPMQGEADCMDQYDEAPTRPVAVVSDGRLGDVFVYVSEGLDPSLQFPTPGESVTLDQEGCRYHPHVLGVQTGQEIDIANSDGFMHNINATPELNQGFNINQPVEMNSTRTFRAAEVMIPVRCDVHGWMEAYIGVQDHPYFQVTGEDGSFDLDRLPPGDYVVEAWHEEYGTQTQNVTVATGETAEVEFTFSADMAGAEVPLGEPIDLHDHGSQVAGTTSPVPAGAGR